MNNNAIFKYFVNISYLLNIKLFLLKINLSKNILFSNFKLSYFEN